MFPPPIRPIQSSETRRVDEVTTRKIVERVPSPLAGTADGVRITIGANARRLAQDAEQPGEQTSRTPEWQLGEAGEPSESETAPNLSSAAFGNTGNRAQTDTALGATSDEEPSSNTFANRALRALSTVEAAAAGSLLTGTDDADGVWNADASARVPFEVLQRAVTQATAGSEEAAEPAGYSPNEPVFLAPENGGKPFGRAVPFEFTPEVEDRGAGSGQLSDGEVDEMMSELSWSLPVKEPSERPRSVSA
jgi:hypothetical protein